MTRFPTLILAVLAACFWLVPNAVGQIRNEQHVKAEVVTGPSGPNYVAGEQFRVGVRLKIDPGWHIYWKYPGDAGAPTTVKWTLPDGFTAGELEYPVPHEIDEPGGIIAYSYEDTVVLSALITPPAKQSRENITVTADVSWLVCKDVCIPGKASPSLQIIAWMPGELNLCPGVSGLFVLNGAPLPVPLDRSEDIGAIQSTGSLADGQVTVKVRWKNPPADASTIAFFPSVPPGLIAGKPTVKTDGDTTTIRFPFEVFDASAVPSKPMQAVIAYGNRAGRKGVAFDVPLRTDPTTQKTLAAPH